MLPRNLEQQRKPGPAAQLPPAECDVCRSLVHERQLAEARGDWHKVSDLNTELKNHPHVKRGQQ
ncbi:hypothetical protein SSP35_05_02680 [Streptomyces sp. NBRC 110611]|uniref:hypothetical protein n=1 Tax=Streptomyces sp. NBRC 110611 TaxID=1621259 RepID=UPI00082CFD29|nr:hypothetical protein [Streptomyces sp. NBRC 110611]GAU67701.1 hypothetical protein SSP35_05_02680 [Streptomyces sp. NBRC 110611]